MLINVVYFYPRNNDECFKYMDLWESNKQRTVIFRSNLRTEHQLENIQRNIGPDKDIFAIRPMTMKRIQTNPIIKSVLEGKGIKYGDGQTWFPKQVWIYNPKN